MAARHDQATVVAIHLGIGEGACEARELAAQYWPRWAAAAPELAAVPGGADGLLAYLRSAPPTRADQVLRALTRLGAVDGEDDCAAALTVAWALLPGACTLAGRLSGVSDRIGEQVAAQLWIEIRTFPWQRLERVAANVLMTVRAAVLAECGVSSQASARRDRAWSRTTVMDPGALTDRLRETEAAAPGLDPGSEPVSTRGGRATQQELLDLLDWACANDVIGGQDRRLLLSLTRMADQLADPDARPGRLGRRAGLLRNDLMEQAGQAWGVGPATVRRRATRSIQALSDAAVAYTSDPYVAEQDESSNPAGRSTARSAAAAAARLAPGRRPSVGVPA